MSSLDFGVGSLIIASTFFGSGFKPCAVSKCPIKSTSCTLRASLCLFSLIDFWCPIVMQGSGRDLA